MDKNVLVLVPSLGIGGQERQAILLAEQLKELANCRIVVFFMEDLCYHTDVEVLNLHLPPSKNKLKKFVQQFRRAAKLARLRKKDHIDLVVSFGDTANLTNILSRGKGESVVSLRISWEAEYSVVRKFMYGKSDRLLCQTEAMKEKLLDNFNNLKQKSTVFYNIFDVDGIEKKAQEACSLEQENDLMVITVGRLHKQKGFRHLIRAFATIIHVCENVKLIIVGGGDEYKALKELAEDLGVQANVIFTDVVSNPYKYMKNADIFVLSSCTEGFPNVLVEAMVCGLPVIATDCVTGPREILSSIHKKANTATSIEYSDYGVLVPAFRSDEIQERDKERFLATAMLDLLENQEKRKYYAGKAKKRAYEFSVANARSKICDMFIK